MKPTLLSAIHNWNWIITLAVFAFVVVTAGQALGQLDEVPSSIDSIDPVGEPKKVQLENGGYQLVSKNKHGQTIGVEEYEPAGAMLRVIRKVKESRMVWISMDRKSVGVSVKTYEDDPAKIGQTRSVGETVFKYDEGVLREKSAFRAVDGYIVPDERTVTRYTPGQKPEGVTQREKRDPKTRKWVKDSPYTGIWRIEAEGKQQPGDYSFLEAPGVSEIRHDEKVWLLMLGSQIEKRTVVVPDSSKDHLGFRGRFIQLKGNADAGRLEFWLTPDQTTMDFQPTKYVLVREDN